MSHYDFSGWTERKMDMSYEWVLKTIGHIFEDADKEGLTEEETCQLKDCWTILAMLEGFSHEHEHTHAESEGNGTAQEMANRVNGTVLK